MKDAAVSIRDVKKYFHLPHEKEDSIKLKVLNSFKKSKTKGHDEYKALNGISFDIKKGEFFGILGRNGAGKSTLLKIIAEIYRPTEGSIKVNGKLVPFIELGVGFNENLSGRDNVYLNGAMLGFNREEVDKMYDSIVEFAELEDFMDQKLKNYSSGMKVRLAFSMAIRADADILLLDEVLAVGDAAFQMKCNEYFDSLSDNKKTVILVTHSMGAVRKYCDRGVLIDGGKVVYEGSGMSLADAYQKLFDKEDNVTHPDNTSLKTPEKVKINKTDSVISEDTIEIILDVENTVDREINDIDVILEIYQLSDDRTDKQLVAGVGKDMTRDVARPISIKPLEKTQIKCTIQNIFGFGDFSVDIAIKDTATRELLSKKENATILKCRSSKTNYLAVIPRTEFTKTGEL